MEVITTELLNNFYILTKKDLSLYFTKILRFFEGGDYNNLVSFYKGEKKSIGSKPYMNLESLTLETNQILRLFESNSRQMNNSNWWELLDQIEEIESRLATVNHINKWSRSSFTSVSYSPTQVVDLTLRQAQSLEDLSSSIGQSSNPQDDWVEIAYENDLDEEDYTVEGEVDLRVTSDPRRGSNFKLNSVVDIVNGKSVYGKDIYQKLQFNETSDDLVILSPEETILQSIRILAKLRKNDNPLSPNRGIQTSVVLGGSKVSFNFPIINRQIRETFESDDSIKDFQITNLYFEEDNAYIDFQVTSRLGEVIELSSLLS